ncbi:hypothetical protein ABR360_004702 [Escherichia coli]|nr:MULTISPECIES: hypothetical protein [Enterobacteriaceae]HBN3195216.1 hypothetical protein [Escherichia coli O25b:H4-ST131]HDV6336255.1 hypothetical protein [Klebsiella michiganensis]MBH8515934.1 hypothetical protein [Klebsiella pneumoniae]MCO0813807.1 hypothetical protein [Enterobacter hormaechei]MCR4215404.1 hypothetical protein [Enterobacter cloacae]
MDTGRNKARDGMASMANEHEQLVKKLIDEADKNERDQMQSERTKRGICVALILIAIYVFVAGLFHVMKS